MLHRIIDLVHALRGVRQIGANTYCTRCATANEHQRTATGLPTKNSVTNHRRARRGVARDVAERGCTIRF